jgi:thiol-disulfide isomerase/thioredoxin
MPKLIVVVFALLTFAPAACAPMSSSSSTLAPTTVPPTTAPNAEAPTAAAAPAEISQPDDLPAWLSLPLVDARTGETFTLGDFSGKLVFVEPMATWCSNCRRQMQNLVEVRQQLNDPNIVYIGLSVETTLDRGDLAGYADTHGFDWTFAVMTPEMVSALTDTFGRSVTVPPSSPHFLIYPDGSLSPLSAGRIESTAELVQLLTEASA